MHGDRLGERVDGMGAGPVRVNHVDALDRGARTGMSRTSVDKLIASRRPGRHGGSNGLAEFVGERLGLLAQDLHQCGDVHDVKLA